MHANIIGNIHAGYELPFVTIISAVKEDLVSLNSIIAPL